MLAAALEYTFVYFRLQAPSSSLDWYLSLALFPILCVGGGLLAWRFLPRLIALGRMVPPEAPREKEGNLIYLIGTIVLSGFSLLSVGFLVSWQISEGALSALLMCWIVGVVLSLWGLWCVVQGHRQNPQWMAAKPKYRVLSLCLGTLMRATLPLLTAVILVMLCLKHQGVLETTVWKIKNFFGF